MFESIDTRALKRANPIVPLMARYGIALRSSGHVLVGRCPFHPDGGRPNLTVYPAVDAADDTYFCFRCSAFGDAITFVRDMDGLRFLEACACLAGSRTGPRPATARGARVIRARTSRPSTPHTADELACLAAAVELYQNRLLHDERALDYLQRRGLDEAVLRRCRLGYAAAEELVPYLRWRRLPLGAAMRAGLLRPNGGETLAGRIIIPEIRGGQPVWLIGRVLDSDPSSDAPRYLGLPGRKPLLGWEQARREPAVFLTEGPFDWLALVRWGLPALALVGTNVRPSVVSALTRFERVYLALDNDEAGHEAAQRLAEMLGQRTSMVKLPDGVKDVAELGQRPGGRERFLAAVHAQEEAVAA
jgi:DNA primase